MMKKILTVLALIAFVFPVYLEAGSFGERLNTRRQNREQRREDRQANRHARRQARIDNNSDFGSIMAGMFGRRRDLQECKVTVHGDVDHLEAAWLIAAAKDEMRHEELFQLGWTIINRQ